MIKKLHYVWLGGGKKPASVKSCIKTWKKYCPDWEIIQWDETNFAVNKYTWTREAMEQKKFAFVADFIRLYVLYHYGGVYIDTDVDILRPIDDTLNCDFACAVQVPIGINQNEIYNRKSVQTGFLYSEKGHPFPLIALRELYENGERHFVNQDGGLDTLPIDCKLMSVLIDSFGAEPVDKTQKLKDNTILYKSSVYATRKSKNKDSYIVHWFDQSWVETRGMKARVKRFIKRYLYFLYRRQ